MEQADYLRDLLLRLATEFVAKYKGSKGLEINISSADLSEYDRSRIVERHGTEFDMEVLVDSKLYVVTAILGLAQMGPKLKLMGPKPVPAPVPIL